MALVEAIDYSNVVWRVHAGGPLFRLPRAEGVARLSHPVGTADEFGTVLSGLCIISSQAQVPGMPGDTKLIDLRDYLLRSLGDGGARAAVAIDALRLLFELRVGKEHSGTEQRARKAMAGFGVSWPPADWSAVWTALQSKVVTALEAVRQEVEQLIE